MMKAVMGNPGPAERFLKERIGRLRALPNRRIVFPEGGDERVIEAAARLKREGILEPVLLEGPLAASERYTRIYEQRRKDRGAFEPDAAEVARRPLYRAALMVAAGDADGFVGGAVNTTAETVRAALRCIGPAAGVRTVSGCFLMAVRDRSFGLDGMLAFADCAMVAEPDAEQLAEIAVATARTVRYVLGAAPVVALLSFSTNGSAGHACVDKVREAVIRARVLDPEIQIDGEMQADAALVERVGRSKMPDSLVAGRANALVFPNLDAANIGYKLVERLGGAMAIGPILQGLAKPANDLSRGCPSEDIYGTAVITALQAHAAV